jgi:SAM-dependent methyltransferase
MERLRFQGVTNIIRFNRHFYVLSIVFVIVLIVTGWRLAGGRYWGYAMMLSLLVVAVSGISLLVSFYVYDLSGLYSLQWLGDVAGNGLGGVDEGLIVNIHAGFDETSRLLVQKFPSCELKVFDFYDPVKHTEVSIARARKAYPPFPGTVRITTDVLPLEDGSVDTVFLMFAAHEIRDMEERVVFFKELNRVLAPSGRMIITEHLRDLPNFLAYNIGFFHFLPASVWAETFRRAGFFVKGNRKVTAFLSKRLFDPFCFCFYGCASAGFYGFIRISHI